MSSSLRSANNRRPSAPRWCHRTEPTLGGGLDQGRSSRFCSRARSSGSCPRTTRRLTSGLCRQPLDRRVVIVEHQPELHRLGDVGRGLAQRPPRPPTSDGGDVRAGDAVEMPLEQPDRPAFGEHTLVQEPGAGETHIDATAHAYSGSISGALRLGAPLIGTPPLSAADRDSGDEIRRLPPDRDGRARARTTTRRLRRRRSPGMRRVRDERPPRPERLLDRYRGAGELGLDVRPLAAPAFWRKFAHCCRGLRSTQSSTAAI